LNGQWERRKDALRSSIRLAGKLQDFDAQRDFEVKLFQARQRSTVDFESLLNDILPWLKSRAALPRQRICAAIVALKVASDVGPASTLDEIYAEVAPLLEMDDIEAPIRLEAEIIYRTMRGKDPLDLQLLRQFVDATRAAHGEIAYSHALVTASSACRIAAHDEEAMRFIKLAFEHASAHKLRARMPVINLSEIRLHVARCDWRTAREVLLTEQIYPVPNEDTNTRAEWDFFDARVAVEEGDFARVNALVAQSEPELRNFNANRRSAWLAVKLRSRLATGVYDQSVTELIEELERVHRLNRDIGNQDYEAHALFAGLTAIGRSDHAMQVLNEYVTCRMTRRPLLEALRVKLGSPLSPVLRTHSSGLPHIGSN
jgi:hypothetical protein